MDTTHQKESIGKLIEEVLEGRELKLTVDSHTMQENFESGEVTIDCDVHDLHTGERGSIHGEGVGIVDAFFNGLVHKYSDEFQSLKTIRFDDFSIHADVHTFDHEARSDMAVQVTLRVVNSENREFVFESDSKSITRSSIEVVLKAVEFFVNSERAFIDMYKALEHARSENRVDTIQRYTSHLATLVQATSYSEVIEKIRRDEELDRDA